MESDVNCQSLSSVYQDSAVIGDDHTGDVASECFRGTAGTGCGEGVSRRAIGLDAALGEPDHDGKI